MEAEAEQAFYDADDIPTAGVLQVEGTNTVLSFEDDIAPPSDAEALELAALREALSESLADHAVADCAECGYHVCYASGFDASFPQACQIGSCCVFYGDTTTTRRRPSEAHSVPLASIDRRALHTPLR